MYIFIYLFILNEIFIVISIIYVPLVSPLISSSLYSLPCFFFFFLFLVWLTVVYHLVFISFKKYFLIYIFLFTVLPRYFQCVHITFCEKSKSLHLPWLTIITCFFIFIDQEIFEVRIMSYSSLSLY